MLTHEIQDLRFPIQLKSVDGRRFYTHGSYASHFYSGVTDLGRLPNRPATRGTLMIRVGDVVAKYSESTAISYCVLDQSYTV